MSYKLERQYHKVEAHVSNTPGALYVVATPIGNLEDMPPRAIRMLSQADLIAAEDTRHSAVLLRHFGVSTPVVAFHEYNERLMTLDLIGRLSAGSRIALISDAGTPLVNDPGFNLVRAAQENGIPVVPIPGPCAAIVALSAAGLPSDRFAFEGFPPVKTTARRARFEELRKESRTLIFYESPHRIIDCLGDMAAVFGGDRLATFARELTKQFETIRSGTLGELSGWVREDANQCRGEMVVLVQGERARKGQEVDSGADRVLRILLAELPLKQAAALAAQITGVKKNQLYEYALNLDLQGR
ncbi:MAG: 16S rRNA (cytidine(1402)-2'-O)-methyltransferase [Acidiferrobacterales bacterium]